MMQAKNEDAQRNALVERQKSLNEQFLSLPRSEQELVTNFFHLHNCAIWFYNFMMDESKSYVDFCIQMVNEGNKIEQDEGALVS